jgi:hypothetical protein
VATSLNNLAELYRMQGRHGEAIAFHHAKGLAIEETNLTENLALGIKDQKRNYITQLQGSTNWPISFHLQDQPINPRGHPTCPHHTAPPQRPHPRCQFLDEWHIVYFSGGSGGGGIDEG